MVLRLGRMGGGMGGGSIILDLNKEGGGGACLHEGKEISRASVALRLQ